MSRPLSAAIPDPSRRDRGTNADRTEHHDAVAALLDYGWWASNGPTGGYLTSLAIDSACRATGISPSWARSVDLHVGLLAAAARYQTTVSVLTGPSHIAIATVTFTQEQPFATAAVHFSPPRGTNNTGDAEPPAVLLPEAYAEMAVGLSAPPVMSQISYRPTANAEGRSANKGWDLVWVRPVLPTRPGRISVSRLLDSWYPPNHMRAVRAYLAGAADQLIDPPAVNLLAASMLFPAAEEAYTTERFTLVGNRIEAITDGHYYERSEAWSEAGELLLVAHTMRRNQHSHLESSNEA